MGHTFLFRGGPKEGADIIDRWLAVLGTDAALLADCIGDVRSLARLRQRFETLSAERARKGRARYRETTIEAIETLLTHEQAPLARGGSAVYPSLILHLQKKARYALRLARADGEAAVSGASALKEASFYLSLVEETMRLCPQYLDPSERRLASQVRAVCDTLEDVCRRIGIYGAGGAAKDCDAILSEADEAVTAYRRLLLQLDSRAEAGNLLAVFPPTFFTWADGTCALAHRCLKRIARGKAVFDIAGGLDEEPADDGARAKTAVPIVVLAENAEEEEQTVTREAEEAQAEDTASSGAAETETDAETGEESAPPAVERIYAKASDYKHVVEKTIQKQKKPRPLGRRT